MTALRFPGSQDTCRQFGNRGTALQGLVVDRDQEHLDIALVRLHRFPEAMALTQAAQVEDRIEPLVAMDDETRTFGYRRYMAFFVGVDQQVFVAPEKRLDAPFGQRQQLLALVALVNLGRLQDFGVVGDSFRFVQRRPALIDLEQAQPEVGQLAVNCSRRSSAAKDVGLLDRLSLRMCLIPGQHKDNRIF